MTNQRMIPPFTSHQPLKKHIQGIKEVSALASENTVVAHVELHNIEIQSVEIDIIHRVWNIVYETRIIIVSSNRQV